MKNLLTVVVASGSAIGSPTPTLAAEHKTKASVREGPHEVGAATKTCS